MQTCSRPYASPIEFIILINSRYPPCLSTVLSESKANTLRFQGNEEEAKLTSKTSEQRTLECEGCNGIIGMEDPSVNGWRLLKANVSLNTAKRVDQEQDAWESHSTETIIAAQLLELIERESARRFVVHRGEKTGLLVCPSSICNGISH